MWRSRKSLIASAFARTGCPKSRGGSRRTSANSLSVRTPYSSRIRMVSITDALLRRWSLPDPTKGGSKEQRGRALIIAGAEEMPGAAILASTAALRAGCGKVRVAVPESATLAVGCALPELFVLPLAGHASLRAIVDSAGKARAVLIGPGMRDTAAIRFLLPRLLRLPSIGALIVDATAL